jgi:hypothetical protein
MQSLHEGVKRARDARCEVLPSGAVARAQHRGGAGARRARGAGSEAGRRVAGAVRALAAAGGRAADLRARLRAARRQPQAPRVPTAAVSFMISFVPVNTSRIKTIFIMRPTAICHRSPLLIL